MKKEIFTQNAPAPVGPYSQAVQVGDIIYVSGQIALDPESNKLNNESLTVEVVQVFYNVTQILKAANVTVADVVRVDIFMTDITAFASINELYEKWLGGTGVKPTRQTIEVSSLPKGANFELSCIVHLSH